MEEKKDEFVEQINTIEANNETSSNEKQKKVKLKFRTKENDISWRGPLSYRYIRLIGWIVMGIVQLTVIFKVSAFVNPDAATGFKNASDIISSFSALPLALFMMANFGVILRNRHNFKYLLTFYGGVALALYVTANFVTLYYAWGLASSIVGPALSFTNFSQSIAVVFSSIGTGGYVFNLFIDLFLFVLTFFFVYYNPKKVFTGKKRIIFRLFVLLPIAYEVASGIIKYNVGMGNLAISHFVFFLLTCKPPLMFLAFLILCIIIKVRENKFLKKFDNNHKLLLEHYSTNANSLRSSISMFIVFNIVALIDVIIFVGLLVVLASNAGAELTEETILQIAKGLKDTGLGGSVVLFLAAPIALLFSYNKTHKNKKLDSLVPIIGFAFIALIYIEGMYYNLTFFFGANQGDSSSSASEPLPQLINNGLIETSSAIKADLTLHEKLAIVQNAFYMHW